MKNGRWPLKRMKSLVQPSITCATIKPGKSLAVKKAVRAGPHDDGRCKNCVDEVGAGVNRTLLNTIADAILRLNKERNYTFVVIEHDMNFIERLCDPVICMAEGRVLAEGTWPK